MTGPSGAAPPGVNLERLRSYLDEHHPGDRAQLRDEIEPVRREGCRVGVPPCGDAPVDAVQVGVRALEVGKRAEPEAAHDGQE